MLKSMQIIFTRDSLPEFEGDNEWSNNILPQGIAAHEVTIGSCVGNQFLINKPIGVNPGDEILEPLTITATELHETEVEVPTPLILYAHERQISSIRVHRNNKYNTSTIINVLVSTSNRSISQLLDDIETTIDIVASMCGEEFGDEDKDLGGRLTKVEGALKWNDTYLE